MRHGSEASSIGRVTSLRHSDLAVFNYFQFSSVQFTVPERCTRSYAANVFSVQFSANGSDGCHSHRVVSDLHSGRSHSCLFKSSISSRVHERHRPPWPRKPAVVHLLLVAHSTHALQAHSFSDDYVVLPAVVGERRYELVQLSPPWRLYTPNGVPTIGDCAIDVHHHRGLPQACHGRVDARHARQVAAHSWIAERGRAREQREPSQPTKRHAHGITKTPSLRAFETGALLEAKKRPESKGSRGQQLETPVPSQPPPWPPRSEENFWAK